MATRKSTWASLGLLLCAVLAVGAPSSFFIHKACNPQGFGEYLKASSAFFTSQGCSK